MHHETVHGVVVGWAHNPIYPDDILTEYNGRLYELPYNRHLTTEKVVAYHNVQWLKHHEEEANKYLLENVDAYSQEEVDYIHKKLGK